MPRKPQVSSAKPSLVFPNEPATVVEPVTESAETVSESLTETVTPPPPTVKIEFNPYELLHSISAQEFIIQIGVPNKQSMSKVWIERDEEKFPIDYIYVTSYMIPSEITYTAKKLVKETLFKWGSEL